MFVVNPETGTVDMTSGDTGSIDMEAVREDNGTWGEEDRAVFTLKSAAGEEIMYRIYAMDTDGGTGTFSIPFVNADTDNLSRGTYYWDVRYVVAPVYNADSSRIVDGNQVITPRENMQFNVTKAQTEV